MFVSVPLVTAGVCTTAVCGWFFTRRTAPPLLPSSVRAYLETVNGTDGVVIKPGVLTEAEREVMTDSFLKGPDFAWMMREPDHETLDPRKHRDGTRYMLEVMFRFAQRYGYVLIARGNGDNTEHGTFLGAVYLLPPYTRRWLYKLHFYRSVLPLGRPVPTTTHAAAAARFDVFCAALDYHRHTVVCQDTPHWYVATVAVAPSAQGHGVGRKLLAVAQECAAHDAVPLFLDCHDGNVPFYEKMGMVSRVRYVLRPNHQGQRQSENVTEQPDDFYFHAMVHEPKNTQTN
jgi:GNAT superfamily N-acetyltransferase